MSSSHEPIWFGSYRLTSRVAAGGMAEVYVGRRQRENGALGPMVAVKRLLPHLTKDQNIVRMFLNEARITAQIDHPNVVRVLDLNHVDGEPYIAMELLDGKSFADLRQRAAQDGKRVPLGVTLRVLTEACRGLDAAHRAVDEEGRPLRIVHRDFTPDNIHVGVDGRVKVIDFGIAKALRWGSATEPGTLKGKFFYMSPEMIAGGAVDHRADLFAAGVMLYEQLCGRRPFTGQTSTEILMRIADGRPRRPTEFDPSVPPALEAICLKALKREPEQRFPSLQEFIGEIEAVGGVAALATLEELGGYINELFPAEEDPSRRTLRRARQEDPSIPAQALAPAPAPPPAPAKLELPRRRLSWPVVVGSALVTAAVVGSIVFWAVAPRLTPAERLGEAEAASAAADRAKALRGLADDERVTAEQLARAGELLLEAGAFEPALELGEAYQARFPRDARAALLEARAAMRLRQGKRTEAAVERAQALGPSSIEPDLLLAELRELQGETFAALEALTRAAKKRPGSIELSARRGYLLSQTGKLDEAAEVLTGVLQRKFLPGSAAELAFVRFRQGKFDEASALLRRALKQEPRLAIGHYYLGAELYRKGDLKGAARAYREADKLAPTDSRPLIALCEIQARHDSAGLTETRRLIASRFPEDSARLLALCGR